MGGGGVFGVRRKRRFDTENAELGESSQRRRIERRVRRDAEGAEKMRRRKPRKAA
jgi:hypothetical protein